jgi:steroid delta-isomerase-like uncharacterized protein
MATRENEAISRQFLQTVWTDGNLDAIPDLVADDAVFHDRDASDYRGIGELRAFVKTYRDAFPDVRYTVDEQITGGDTVVTHWTARGTHRGELMDLAPTGREVEVHGISIDRFADGRITESTAHWDALGMLQQLGAVPEQITRKT